MRKIIIKIFTVFVGFLLISDAYADTIAEIPSIIDAGRIQRQISEQQPTPPIGGAPIQHPEKKNEGLMNEKIHLKLTRVIITGNTVFSTRELEAIFASSINKTITLKDLSEKVDEITTKYRSAGYILSRAFLPAQEIKNGVVKVEVIEGYISKVDIQGKPGCSRYLLNCYSKYILASRPLKIQTLEKELLLANDNPGLSVKSVINPSATTPDSADLTLVANQKYLSGYYTYNDYGTRFLGPIQTLFGGSVNSVLVPGDSNTVNFATTSQTDELHYAEYIYSRPICCNGLRWDIGTNYTETHPQFTLSGLNIIGRSFSAYSDINYSIIRSRIQNLSLRGSANYQNVTSTILDAPFYQDRFRTLTVGAFYDTADRWEGYNNMDLMIQKGFDIMGAGNHLLQSRPRGDSNFLKFNGDFAHQQPLYKRLSGYVSLQAQYSCEPLLATEQYGYGGPIYGRGNGPSEIVGDKGGAGKVELRYLTMPEWHYLQSVEFYVFYDAGIIWNIDTIDLPNRQSGTNTGIGARMNFMPNLAGEFYIAKPLTLQATTLTPPGQNPFQARGFFQLTASA